ncbi:MAG TPA: chorismate mutase, partial [Armatimonadota bacterium]|nr:chorismate mutase [Armatimonadota bacterium]
MSEQQPADMAQNTIQAIRWSLDQVDERIVDLLNQRAELARRIGVLKETFDSAAFVPARERAVLEHVAGASQGPLPN